MGVTIYFNDMHATPYQPSQASFESLTREWINATDSGSLLTPKHDINQLEESFSGFRTVLTAQLSASLETLIRSKDFSITEYFNTTKNNHYYTLELTEASQFPVAGYQAISGSIDTSKPYDTIVLFSGSQAGWHVISEEAAKILEKQQSGRLVFQQTLTR
jgi:hypothetical protein